MAYQKIKLLFVSRDVPLSNFQGSGNIILSFLNYLADQGFEIEYVLLEPVTRSPSPIIKIPNYVKLKPLKDLKVGPYLVDVSIKHWVYYFYTVIFGSAPSTIKEWILSIRKFYKIRMKRSDREQAGTFLLDSMPNDVECSFAQECAEGFRPDVIIANYAWLGYIFDVIPENPFCLRALFTHDVLHQRYKDYLEKDFTSNQSIKTRESEIEALSKAQLILAIQKEDAETFKEMLPTKDVITVPLAKDLITLKVAQVQGRCLFVGSGADHNVFGLRWFLDEVWPIVIDAIPESQLHIVGTVCQEFGEKYRGVHFLSHVNNLDVEYAAAEVCIVPLLVGSGLKIKLIEALAYGKACVSTSVGIQGLREVEGKAVAVADTSQEFAQTLIQVLKHPEQRLIMEKASQEFIRTHFSPEVAYAPFVNRVREFIKNSNVQ